MTVEIGTFGFFIRCLGHCRILKNTDCFRVSFCAGASLFWFLKREPNLENYTFRDLGP